MEHNLTKFCLLTSLGHREHRTAAVAMFGGFVLATSSLHTCQSYLYRGTGNFIPEAQRRGSLKAATSVFEDGQALAEIATCVGLVPTLMGMIGFKMEEPVMKHFQSCVALGGPHWGGP
jgi:hypothetical protein